MLTATSHGLLRGKASGQGQQLIFARQNLHQEDVFISGTQVYYPRHAPPVLFDYPNRDIWSVRTDGTGDHAVLNTGSDEFVRDANGSIAVYEQNTYGLPDGTNPTSFWSLRDGASHTLLPTERFTQYRFLAGDRAMFNTEHRLFSVNLNGTDARTHATVIEPLTLQAAAAVESTVVFREYNSGRGSATLKAVPVSGGNIVSLDDGQSYVAYAGHVGARVVSQRCVIDSSELPPRAGPCDVVSVNTDGSAPTVLASHSANEAVQGTVGSQVIIRRNFSGNDQLIAVPVTGGVEQLLMTMTDNEFVQLMTDDRIIVRRPSGTWTIDLNGTLKQIGTVNGESGFIAVGDAFCMNKNTAVWCMPLDGEGQAVKIADTGRVLGAL